MAHELLALEVIMLLLEEPSADSVEVAVSFVKEVGAYLQDMSPQALNRCIRPSPMPTSHRKGRSRHAAWHVCHGENGAGGVTAPPNCQETAKRAVMQVLGAASRNRALGSAFIACGGTLFSSRSPLVPRH